MIRNLFKNLPFGIIILLIIVFIYYIYEIFFGMYSFTEIKKLESKKEIIFTENNLQIKKIHHLRDSQFQIYGKLVIHLGNRMPKFSDVSIS